LGNSLGLGREFRNSDVIFFLRKKIVGMQDWRALRRALHLQKIGKNRFLPGPTGRWQKTIFLPIFFGQPHWQYSLSRINIWWHKWLRSHIPTFQYKRPSRTAQKKAPRLKNLNFPPKTGGKFRKGLTAVCDANALVVCKKNYFSVL